MFRIIVFLLDKGYIYTNRCGFSERASESFANSISKLGVSMPLPMASLIYFNDQNLPSSTSSGS